MCLSIIVGCLVTLRPLFRRSNLPKPQRDASDGQPLQKQVGEHSDGSRSMNVEKGVIQHTTSIIVQTARRSFGDSLPKHDTWTTEDNKV